MSNDYPEYFRRQTLTAYKTMYPVRRFFMRSWWRVVIGKRR